MTGEIRAHARNLEKKKLEREVSSPKTYHPRARFYICYLYLFCLRIQYGGLGIRKRVDFSFTMEISYFLTNASHNVQMLLHLK